MRILLFASSYAPNTGGLETVTRRLALELARRGHSVTVATNRYPIRLVSHEIIDEVSVHRQIYPDIPLRERPASIAAFLKMIALLPLMPVAALRLVLLLKRIRPDVVNVHYLSYPAAYAIWICRLMRLPVVLSLHGSDVASARYDAGQRLYLRWALRCATLITTCSHSLAQSLQQFTPPREHSDVVVAHNGIDIPLVSQTFVERPAQYALTMARLVEIKGVDIAIRAIAVLRRRNCWVRLVIAGDGPMRSRLQSLAHEEGVDDLVAFIGSLTAPELSPLLQGALFCVVPSRREAFGMACLEAMASGKAVIASRVGGIPEIVLDGDTGLLVPPDDAGALADAMALLLARPDRALAMGIQGRRRAAHSFTWEGTIDDYLDAYAAACRDNEVHPFQQETHA